MKKLTKKTLAESLAAYDKTVQELISLSEVRGSKVKAHANAEAELQKAKDEAAKAHKAMIKGADELGVTRAMEAENRIKLTEQVLELRRKDMKEGLEVSQARAGSVRDKLQGVRREVCVSIVQERLESIPEEYLNALIECEAIMRQSGTLSRWLDTALFDEVGPVAMNAIAAEILHGYGVDKSIRGRKPAA